MAPFIGVSSSDAPVAAQLSRLVAVDESFYFVGVAPQLPPPWKMEEHAPIVQMLCFSRADAAKNDAEISILSDADIPAMMELTSLVYPEFFRSRTAELGTYLGIYKNERLVAMAGERMHLTSYREISAVCTHPDHIGQGYARRLINHLVNVILGRNEIPFLHVSSDNARAKSLYESLGFTSRCSIPLWSVKRLE
jgi:ribosomal protein S18 acetylase RimI-like enzyme